MPCMNSSGTFYQSQNNQSFKNTLPQNFYIPPSGITIILLKSFKTLIKKKKFVKASCFASCWRETYHMSPKTKRYSNQWVVDYSISNAWIDYSVLRNVIDLLSTCLLSVNESTHFSHLVNGNIKQWYQFPFFYSLIWVAFAMLSSVFFINNFLSNVKFV